MSRIEIAVDLPQNGECVRCIDRLQGSVALMRGVEVAEVDRQSCRLVLDYDPETASLERLAEVARDLGAGIGRRYAHETVAITDMDCADCAAKLEAAVGRLPGVTYASVNFVSGTMAVEYESDRVDRAQIAARVQGLGYEVAEAAPPAGESLSEFGITGMDCADCAVTIERNLNRLNGVAEAKVNFTAAKLSVRHAPSVSADDIRGVVEGSGYGLRPLRAPAAAAPGGRSFWLRNRRALLTLGSGLSLVLGFAVSLLEVNLPFAGIPAATPLFALAMALGGYFVARSGVYGLTKSRTLDMNVLMTIAALGAAAIGEWAEGATVVFLFGFGNVLEGYTMDRARGAIRALMELAPAEARVRRAGRESTVAAEAVAVGEVVLVRPGERVPVDGRVVLGASAVNQAPITGESVPVEKGQSDEVFAGSIVEGGYLEVEATRPYAENTISRIARLVEEAQARRAPAQRFVERFSHYYTPAVIVGAVGVAVVPWLVLGQPFEPWFYRALVLLVIACPCALVISTPVAIVSAIARAARLGILIKGGAYLEEAGRLRAVAFDKTGTLTVGRPEVTEVIPLNGLSAAEVLGVAAAIEARSEHPLAAAVVRRAAGASGDGRLRAVSEFEALVGRGVRASVDGRTYYVGSPRLFAELGLSLAEAQAQVEQLQSDGQTVLLLGTEESLLGVIGLADRVRPGAKAAVDSLRRAGVAHVALLTGDHEATARAIAGLVGADEYRAGLLPEDKVKAVADIRARHGSVAMVGDGVNDAPALAAANLGVAMGAAGTDVALETADIALMADDLGKVAVAVDLSRKALAVIRANIAFALVVKGIFLALTAAGVATLWLAILADTGASLIVILNGMRLLRSGTTGELGGPQQAAPEHERDREPGHDHEHQHAHEH